MVLRRLKQIVDFRFIQLTHWHSLVRASDDVLSESTFTSCKRVTLKNNFLAVKHHLIYYQNANSHWVLRHVVAPPKTQNGERQRPPTDLHDLQKYEVIRTPAEKEPYMIKVILLEDVEGIGHQYDVLELDHTVARDELLLPKKAVYASPFDLKYYMEQKEKKKEELARKVRVPYEYVKLGRTLMSKIIPIHISIDQKWQLSPTIISASLFESNIHAPMETVFLPKKYRLSGPNFDLEASLIRFYIVVNQQYVIPMVGRVAHISSDEHTRSLYPESIQVPTPEQMASFCIHEEQPLYSEQLLDSKTDIVSLMQKKIEQFN